MRVIAVLGSGMAGLGAATRLQQEGLSPVVFDMNGHLGGHTFSHAGSNGFVFDEGPHISFTKDKRIQAFFADNVRGQFEVIHARVNNYWQGRSIKHPAQCNLYGLPTDLVVKILKEIVDAHYTESKPSNYEDWLIASFGRTFAETFPMQYGQKYHTTEASNMSLDWLGPRLYRPGLEEVFRGALTPETSEVHYITEFRYPSQGGFVSFLKPFAEGLDLRLNHRLTRLDPKARTLKFANDRVVNYDQVVSSIPLPELVKLITGAPKAVVEAASRLACSTCVVVNVGLDRADVSDWHWTYFYDDDFSFSRISFPHMLSPNNAPAGMGSIQVEVYFSAKYKPLTQAPADLVAPVIGDLRRCGLIRDRDRIVCTSALEVKYANVIFDLDRADAVRIVHAYLDDIGVRYCGRYGEWGYLWTDESFISGEKAAERAIAALSGAAIRS